METRAFTATFSAYLLTLYTTFLFVKNIHQWRILQVQVLISKFRRAYFTHQLSMYLQLAEAIKREIPKTKLLIKRVNIDYEMSRFLSEKNA